MPRSRLLMKTGKHGVSQYLRTHCHPPFLALSLELVLTTVTGNKIVAVFFSVSWRYPPRFPVLPRFGTHQNQSLAEQKAFAFMVSCSPLRPHRYANPSFLRAGLSNIWKVFLYHLILGGYFNAISRTATHFLTKFLWTVDKRRNLFARILHRCRREKRMCISVCFAPFMKKSLLSELLPLILCTFEIILCNLQ